MNKVTPRVSAMKCFCKMAEYMLVVLAAESIASEPAMMSPATAAT